ncbi:MAG: hypothetical protein ACRC62_24715 [Microcoleus sp.]
MRSQLIADYFTGDRPPSNITNRRRVALNFPRLYFHNLNFSDDRPPILQSRSIGP